MKTSTFHDRSKWSVRGPWDSEPDKAEWVDPKTGLDCLAVRARGFWCGYVGVTEGHPIFNKTVDYDNYPDLDVHGGITFSGGFCAPSEMKEPKICHTPEKGRPDRVWWIGFDCAHSGDCYPGSLFTTEIIDYRTLDYVREQCTNLARQIAAIK